MTISELIKVLDGLQDEHGDVQVEVRGGREVFAVGCIFKEGVKYDPSTEQPPVVAVQII